MDKKTVIILLSVVLVCCCVASATAVGIVFVVPALKTTPTPTVTSITSPTPNISITVEPSLTPTKVDTKITSLYDTFDSNKNDWNLEAKEGERVKFKEEIKNGKLIFEMTAVQSVILDDTIRSQPIVNLDMSVDGSQESGSPEGDYALVFRKLDKENYYIFGVNQNYQEYFFSVRKNGEWTDLIKFKKSTIVKIDGVNKLRVVVAGSKFTFYINGQQIDTYTDTTISEGGQVGVACELYNANDVGTFSFDNFSIQAK
jgi:hypothetical protein